MPKYIAPPMATSTSTNLISNGPPSTLTPFDLYKGQHYDAKSVAVGLNLGPDANYNSITETKLEALQQQEAKLVQKMQCHLLGCDLFAS
jgi:hypothetical protein